MVGLGAGPEPGRLHLDEIADMGVRSEHGAGPQPRVRADHARRARLAACEMAEGADLRPGSTVTPGPNTTYAGQRSRPAQAGVPAQEHGLRRRQRRARPPSPRARSQACTVASASASSTRELMPRSSSQGASTAATRSPSRDRQGDAVGQVVLALGLARLHLMRASGRSRPPAAHEHAGVAQPLGPLRGRRVGPLDHARRRVVLRRSRGRSARDRPGAWPAARARAACARLEQAAQRLRADQRVVGIEHRHFAVAEMRRGLQRGVGGAEPLLLHDRRVRRRRPAAPPPCRGRPRPPPGRTPPRSSRSGGSASAGRRSGAAPSAAPTSCGCPAQRRAGRRWRS